MAGATASFRLPDEGPTGVFPNGLRTDLALTDTQGRASLRGLQFNRNPGEFQIRITVAKDNARAGTVSTQYIGEHKMAGAPHVPNEANVSKTSMVQTRAGNSNRKWVVLGLVVAAAAAGGGIAARGHGSTAPAILAPAAIALPAPLSIGPPTIVIGKP